jgi:hypothetical protein
MNLGAWHYFLALERDLIRTLDYVELHSDNAASFSNEYAKLLLLVGSEVDVVAKQLCTTVPGAKKAKNIMAYQEVLTGAFPGIHDVEVSASRYSMVVKPWLSWGNVASAPPWWGAYNDVKHERNLNYRAANQANVFEAFCGLLVLLMYHFRKNDLQPYPQLLERGFPDSLVVGGNHDLPGLTYTHKGALASWELQ